MPKPPCISPPGIQTMKTIFFFCQPRSACTVFFLIPHGFYFFLTPHADDAFADGYHDGTTTLNEKKKNRVVDRTSRHDNIEENKIP
jgi:hypothetical protein